ncbi:hypothetical protein [Streptomyces sp. NPDC017993]|uniref:hypothetical protein n=1 Tax=Streptomyces sp. NPDC017993 TaxID=3365027 RepID=UPI0037B20A34
MFQPDEFATAESQALAAEVSEADAAEQRAELAPEEDDVLQDIDASVASEADLAEQARVVPLDEDDLR